MPLFYQAQIGGRVPPNHATISQAYFRPSRLTGKECNYEQVFLLKRLTNILHVDFSKADSFQYFDYVRADLNLSERRQRTTGIFVFWT